MLIVKNSLNDPIYPANIDHVDSKNKDMVELYMIQKKIINIQ